jgi:hypothetical protein
MERIIAVLQNGQRDRAEIADALKLSEAVTGSVLTAMEYREIVLKNGEYQFQHPDQDGHGVGLLACLGLYFSDHGLEGQRAVGHTAACHGYGAAGKGQQIARDALIRRGVGRARRDHGRRDGGMRPARGG